MTSFLDFILSDYFVWFWILVVIAVIFVPTGVVGFIRIFRWINRKYIKPSKGYLLARQKMPNDQMIEYWVLGTGQNITVKNIKGEWTETPIILGRGWVGYDGSTPIIELDENGNQMPFDRIDVHSIISQEDTTKGWQSAYETGKLVGAMEFFGQIKTLLMIVLIIVFVGIAISSFSVYKQMSTPPIDQNVLADQTSSAILQKMQNTSYLIPQIPKV